MKCPKCSNMDSKVVDSRMIEEGGVIRRRRECERCGHRYTTFERIGNVELVVIKKDGTKEMYDRAKLKKAVMLAFAKRSVQPDVIDALISNLEVKWQSEGSEVLSTKIGEDILASLREIDPVVYVRFASVYQSFNSFEDFKQFIE
ncbi:MAG: transcriptional repressor NrdR [candidate division SR1 bacterium]|nr:transcriptional repressor NrdR [candidate division SR1 bacterium]RKW21396.1 MAG: transcriptional repressor NrdR [Candidatus Gracilibacteria bacterium]